MNIDLVKGNFLPRPPLSLWWLMAGIAASLLSLAGVSMIDHALPEPLTKETALPERFIAENAYEFLVNLTHIGPRVAGSYENEISTVALIVSTVKAIEQSASPHHRIEIDVHRASGAFPLTFLDGMNNIYRDVKSVVVRLSPRYPALRYPAPRYPARRHPALLLNCHYDTVPDSPGGSDDGGGCAVLVETLRALAARRSPLRHDVLLLFNGAEENIMQGSHAFITKHPWAASARAFINIEACGAGGREVLFQAGPHDPWIMEVYAGAVPHPFASSLAQELFESGLIPADTDFRIFRDVGHLSGVDLAWNSNGYVYHTSLDTAEKLGQAALQRTGDNVLSLATGLVSSENMESEVEHSSRQPVFFDVLGLWMVVVRTGAAACAFVVTLAFLFTRLHLNAVRASRTLYIAYGTWWRLVGRGAWLTAASVLAGVGVASLMGVGLHALGVRHSFYSRPWLLAPLYALPAVCVTWSVAARMSSWSSSGGGAVLRYAGGWWESARCADALCVWWGVVTAVCAVLRARSGFLPLLWCALPSLLHLLTTLHTSSHAASACAWALGNALPSLQTWYLALNWIGMFVPLTGRSGSAPVDVISGVLVSTLVLAACSWLLPFVLAARDTHRLVYAGLAVTMLTVLLVVLTPLGFPYNETRPQRLMIFHTRRTVHSTEHSNNNTVHHFYWIPALDVNTPHSLDMYVPEMRDATTMNEVDCAKWVYCGAPYYLPVRSFITRAYALPASSPPLTSLRATLTTRAHNSTVHVIRAHLTGPAHMVMIVSPAAGAMVSRVETAGAGTLTPLAGPTWGARNTYFLYVHNNGPDALSPTGDTTADITLYIQHSFTRPPLEWASLSVAGHSLFGPSRMHEEHRALFARLPSWTAPTGWGIDLHLYSV